MTRFTIALGLVAVLVLGGCAQQPPEFSANEQVPAEDRTEAAAATEGTGGGGDAEAAANTLEFVAVDIAWEEAPTGEVPAGEYTVELINNGAAEHTVVFEPNGGEPVAAAPGGETDQGTFTLEAGTEYRYYCDIPGHESLMNGTITAS